jgi:aspartate 1-decarboxylase
VTYALRGDPGSGIICINGAAAHLAEPGDKVIIATFAEVDAHEAKGWNPTVILVDGNNRVADAEYRELAGPARRVAS